MRASTASPADLASLSRERNFTNAVRASVERANLRLAAIEKVKRFVIASAPFGVDNGQMTPTLKVRRHVVRAAYDSELDALYR